MTLSHSFPRMQICPLLQEQSFCSAFSDANRCVLLQVELAPIVDWGEPFVKVTYKLEGRGHLPFTAMKLLKQSVHLYVQHIPPTFLLLLTSCLEEWLTTSSFWSIMHNSAFSLVLIISIVRLAPLSKDPSLCSKLQGSFLPKRCMSCNQVLPLWTP